MTLQRSDSLRNAGRKSAIRTGVGRTKQEARPSQDAQQRSDGPTQDSDGSPQRR